MLIQLKKFGTTLISRQDGSEALAAFRPTLNELQENEILKVDFSGVITFTPSWADEFLTPLQKEFQERLRLKKSPNLSVKTTLKMLEKIQGVRFEYE